MTPGAQQPQGTALVHGTEPPPPWVQARVWTRLALALALALALGEMWVQAPRGSAQETGQGTVLPWKRPFSAFLRLACAPRPP